MLRSNFVLIFIVLASLVLPATATEPADSSTAPARGLLLVANKWEHTLGIVDPHLQHGYRPRSRRSAHRFESRI